MTCVQKLVAEKNSRCLLTNKLVLITVLLLPWANHVSAFVVHAELTDKSGTDVGQTIEHNDKLVNNLKWHTNTSLQNDERHLISSKFGISYRCKHFDEVE